ncbi:MAG TPA: zf-HC2 domain-containing protein [Pyrinomonadaceae bacterium]|nr:zf-HC2 domain-containing protein [Pyrinomonadaceae bacterium]
MTPNDKQIDLLMRRFAKDPGRATESSHLDADEMSAFAEGVLPPAARAQYVSHLADCDQCRKQVSGLAIAAGAVARTEQSVAEKIERRRFWQILAGFFALPVLRYAAFGAVLLIVAGVAFIALRPRGDLPALVASHESEQQPPVTAVKPATNTDGILNKDANTARSASTPQSPAVSDQNPKRDESRVAENTTSPLQPMKEIAKPVDDAEKKAEQPVVAQKPGYAPAPPGESQIASRAQSGTGGVVTLSDVPAKTADKVTAADRERDTAKDGRRGDVVTRNSSPATAMRRAEDSKQKGPSRNMDNVMANNQSANEVQNAAPKTLQGGASTEESPQTRSVGGHKFRRQGNSWIDQKFKSSMTLRNISRGSDEFAALDSGVRSIAQQLGGEVIVVSKGKAYLIK